MNGAKGPRRGRGSDPAHHHTVGVGRFARHVAAPVEQLHQVATLEGDQHA